MRANQVGTDQQEKAVERDSTCERAASLMRIVVGECQKERACAERIDNWEYGTEDQKDVSDEFGDFAAQMLFILHALLF